MSHLELGHVFLTMKGVIIFMMGLPRIFLTVEKHEVKLLKAWNMHGVM